MVEQLFTLKEPDWPLGFRAGRITASTIGCLQSTCMHQNMIAAGYQACPLLTESPPHWLRIRGNTHPFYTQIEKKKVTVPLTCFIGTLRSRCTQARAESGEAGRQGSQPKSALPCKVAGRAPTHLPHQRLPYLHTGHALNPSLLCPPACPLWTWRSATEVIPPPPAPRTSCSHLAFIYIHDLYTGNNKGRE